MIQEPPIPSRLRLLFDAVCDELATAEQLRELEAVLANDENARHAYLDYCSLHVDLYSAIGGQESQEAIQKKVRADAVEAPETVAAAPIGFISTTLQGTAGYYSSGWPVAYLVATMLLGIGFLVGNLVHVSQPVQLARELPPATRAIPASETQMSFVGRITGMLDCQWADPQTEAFNGAHVPLGRKYDLASGLMEISYSTGAKVILQGPCTYEAESPAGGYLSVGKVTARVENKEERRTKNEELSASRSSFLSPHSYFAVRTPTATVTDLGTEFGVEVSEEGNTTSHVFRGSVELRASSADKGTESIVRVLHANESARVENTGNPDGGNRAIVSNPPTEPVNFVREISKRVSKRSDRFDVIAYWQFDGDNFLADSSGNGHTLVNHGAMPVDGAASFDGTAMMSSVDPIDLTRYTKVRVSWRQKVASAASQHVIWEHDSDNQHSNQDNYRAGMIVVHLTDGKEYACIYTGDSGRNVVEEWNKDQFPVASNVWEKFAVEYDRTAYRASVVRVFKDGTEIATEVAGDGFSPHSFLKAVFRIGAGYELAVPFVGQIDDLKIEGATVRNRR